MGIYKNINVCYCDIDSVNDVCSAYFDYTWMLFKANCGYDLILDNIHMGISDIIKSHCSKVKTVIIKFDMLFDKKNKTVTHGVYLPSESDSNHPICVVEQSEMGSN